MREPVLFRVDGTRQAGWENLARCSVLAAALQRRRRPCYFLSQLEPATLLASNLKRGGNEWLDADADAGSAEDLEELIQEVRRLRPAAIVVDAPGCGPDYLAELVTLGPLVVSIDQLAQHRFPSQLIVNPTLGPGIEDYEVCPGAQLLLGRRYALVRPEIRRLRPGRAQEPPSASAGGKAGPSGLRALIAFGDDPHGLTSRLSRLLLSISKLQNVDIIARPQHPQLPEWQAFAVNHEGRVTVSTESAEIAAKVTRCHFALCDSNSWALEFACIGVPMLVIVCNEWHWPTAKRLEEEGIATCLGWHENVTDATIRTAVQNLAGDAFERQAMSRCGRAFIDGRGPDRLITALEVLLHPSRHMDFSEAA